MRYALILACLLGNIAVAQTQRVLGELTAKDISAKTLSIKPEAGAAATVTYDDKTSFLRVPPGETSLAKAAKIDLDQLQVGDRVLATGTAPAQRIIVMTKTDLAQKQATEHADWQRRGTGGTVVSVDGAAKQINVKRRAMGIESNIAIEVTDKTQFRRYAPDSVKFNDAKASSLAEIKPGDQVRVLGERAADSGKVTAEVVVSGLFRNVAGTVLSVDPAAGQITIRDLETKKPLAVKVNSDSVMRRLPPMMAQMLASRLNRGASGTAPATGATQSSAERRSAPVGGMGSPGGPGGANAANSSGPGGMRGGGGDLQSMFERMPPFQVTELKLGDAVIVNSTTGAEAGRVTAISMLAGVEPLLTAPTPQGDRRLSGSWNMGDINIMP